MRKDWLLLLVFLIGSLNIRPIFGQTAINEAGWDFTAPVPNAEPVTAESQLPGNYLAGSRIRDNRDLGAGNCDNWPRDLGDKVWGKKGVVSLVAFPDEPIAYLKNRGIGLRLINRTGEIAGFSASDSFLYIVQEALDENGVWREIESTPQSWCGNSFHHVFLPANQYWQFRARVYSGPIKTKIRFRLDSTGEADKAQPIYSNEFVGEVAKAQFRSGPDRLDVRRAFRSTDPTEKGVVATLSAIVKDQGVQYIGFESSQPAAARLATFGPAAKEAVPFLLEAMKGKEMTLRATSAYAVWRIAGKTEGTLNTLIEVLRANDEKGSRLEAAKGLCEIGPLATDAIPELCKALADSDEELRSKAAEALGAIHSRPDVVVPELTKALKDSEWRVSYRAMTALGQFGADARLATPQLTDVLKDSRYQLKVAAAFALWKIEGKAEQVVPVLVPFLKNDRDYSSQSAAETLGNIGLAANAAIPDLIEATKKDNRGLRIRAAGALWKITGKPDPALSVLIKAVHDEVTASESSTRHAVTILEDMGPLAKAAIPALLAVQNRSDGWDRERVQKALKKIDPGGN